MRLPWYVYLIAAVVVCGLAWWAFKAWGWASLLLPASAAGVALRETLKAGGAKKVSQNTGARPTHPGGISAESPKPEPGKKRARPRRNSWR